MATEEEIKIKITADTSEFKKGIEDAAKSTEKLSRDTGASSGTKGFNAAMQETSKATEGVKDKFKGIGKEGKKSGGILGKAFNGVKSGFMDLGASSKLATAGAIGVAVAAFGIIGKLAIDIGKKVMQVSGQMAKMYNPAGYEKATNQMNASITKMKTSLGAVLEPVYKAMTAIVGGLADAFNGVLETVLKIYAAIVGFLGLSGTLSKDAEDYSDSMEEAAASADAGLASFDKLNTLDTSGMGDAAQSEKIRNMMAETALSAESFRNSIADAINPAKLLEKIFESMGLSEQWKTFAESGMKAWNKLKGISEKVWGAIVDMVTTYWSYVSKLFENIWNNAVNLILGIWDLVVEYVKNWFAPLVSIWSGIWSAIFKIFTGDFNGAIQALKDGFKGAFEAITHIGENMWNKLVEVGNKIFGGWAKTLTDMFGGVFDFSKFFDDIAKRLEAFVNIFRSFFDGLTLDNLFERILNGYKAVINGIIDMWNNSIANIGWEGEIFGNKVGINTYGLKIPHLATGSVVEPNDPFLAVVGDNTREKEVISPVSTIEEAVRNVIGENGTGQPIQIELSVNLDGRKIARGTYDYLYAEAKRRGEAWH